MSWQLLRGFFGLELVDGIEPSTSPLPRECSTPELHELALSEPALSSARAFGPGIAGAGDGIRTRDIQLGKLTLYQLSYSRTKTIEDSKLEILTFNHVVGRAGFEPA
jgi:hypothetical protein